MKLYLQKVISRKTVKKLDFEGILKVDDENSIIASADPDPDPHQNVMDPQHWYHGTVHCTVSTVPRTVQCTWHRALQLGRVT
jgi:hypothetical protein